jgi:hypothetical protein
MRRIITLSLFVFMAFMTTTAQNGPQLKVWKKDKSTVLFALAEKPVTTFSDNKLVIKTSNATVEYPLADVLRYTYIGVETGIENIESDNSVVVRQEPDKLQLTNLKSDTEVYLYNASGRLLDIQKSDGKTVTISIASRPQGMYIVKCGNETIKLMKR